MTTERDGNQPGQQQHAEGQHGEKTHERLREEISEFRERNDDYDALNGQARTGRIPEHEEGRRLHQDREQHDEAEKNSELRKERG